MASKKSRYYYIDTGTYVDGSGREIAYRKRRFLPRGADLGVLAHVTLQDGERLDLIAARTIGDPQQSWRICDANDAMHPEELVEEAGRTLTIPVPRVEK